MPCKEGALNTYGDTVNYALLTDRKRIKRYLKLALKHYLNHTERSITVILNDERQTKTCNFLGAPFLKSLNTPLF